MTEVKPARHRPTGYSRTLEAAAVFNALRRRGWSWDAALNKASEVCHVGAREIRRGSKLAPMNVISEDNMAEFTLAKKGIALDDLQAKT